jgi:hypothetical protein
VTAGSRTGSPRTEFDCAAEVAADLVSGIGQNVFQAGFDALKRQMAG